ncbi:RNA polymerase sporulation sigma factor SigK [Clostridium bowmanii]|uniref:RNA polymerase sporulation sigma factor SigK n=1 Tax=Clostridium bowmanii TaxID=132925 RepID=UPI001C0B33C2|nr:RNA polymerase sporulation sigma factor SigK [Clostridium bowmanii]MBU3189630.1 RNA polymerase sporulation sigma factor SigK [Clostridium bowmanii]MCA1073524.1 RNA polymerase sporulation sigma factor SigK [Clostridium bowmanii]
MFSINCLLDMIGNITFLTAYITGSSSFPQPLGEEEEKSYLTKFKEGDLLAKGILVERNLRLVAHIVKKYSYPGKDVDDLISIGTVGLIKAIEAFDISKGVRLAAFAARCIENEILMLIRNNKKTKGDVYLQDPIGTDKEGNEMSLIDVLRSDEDSIFEIVENKMQNQKLYDNINFNLMDREKTIIQMRYGLLDDNPRTQREISLILGISRSYVSRIEKRALKRLNKGLDSTDKNMLNISNKL